MPLEAAKKKGYGAIRSGVSGFKIAFARRLNKMLRRTGSVWADRYHRHDLVSPREVFHAFRYIFENFVHHGFKVFGDGAMDFFSSSIVFDGWATPVDYGPDDREQWRWPVCCPKTWLASRGYEKVGRLPRLSPRTELHA